MWTPVAASAPTRTTASPGVMPAAAMRRARATSSARIARAQAWPSSSAALKRGPRGEQLHARVQRLQAGHRRAGEARQLDHRADQRLDLGLAPGLDVLQHRGLVAADARRALDAPLERQAEA